MNTADFIPPFALFNKLHSWINRRCQSGEQPCLELISRRGRHQWVCRLPSSLTAGVQVSTDVMFMSSMQMEGLILKVDSKLFIIYPALKRDAPLKRGTI